MLPNLIAWHSRTSAWRAGERSENDRSLPKICAKGSDLNQVWTNLIDNAIDALAEQAKAGRGQITIHTARDGAFVLVDIIDNGPGIPPEVKSRIFDPFFTTKPVGEGAAGPSRVQQMTGF